MEALLEALMMGLLLLAMILVIGGGLGLLVVALRRRSASVRRTIDFLIDPSIIPEVFRSWLGGEAGDEWIPNEYYEGRSTLEGQKGVVSRAFVPREGPGSQGKVTYEGEIWSAISQAPAESLPKGASCQVVRREGLVLRVEPAT